MFDVISLTSDPRGKHDLCFGSMLSIKSVKALVDAAIRGMGKFVQGSFTGPQPRGEDDESDYNIEPFNHAVRSVKEVATIKRITRMSKPSRA
jgi:hypothetical protein